MDLNKKTLEEKIKIYESMLEEKDNIINENIWYKQEYERIVYSFSYRLMRKVKRIMVKIHLYQLLRWGLNILRKIRNSYIIVPDKISEYKYFRYKCARNQHYPFNSNAVKHDYIEGLVSIVLPVYNGELYLEKTIDSILNQSYKNFELIIVNDGSVDNTLNIINEYVKKDRRIKIINQKNQTLPRSISNGFRQAHGEYYMWVGADDILHYNCVEMLFNELRQDENVDFVFPNVRLIDENDNPIITNAWYSSNKEHPEYVILPRRMYNFNVVKDNYIAPIAMYKSIVVKTLEDFSHNRFTTEDYEYWMRINNIFNIKHTSFDDPIFDYRRHSKSLTSQAKELKISEKTNELMLFEDFRRDYLMGPLMWYIDVDDTESINTKLYENILESIKKAGHLIVDKKDLYRDTYSKVYKNQVYLYIGSDKKNQVKKLKEIPKEVYKVLFSTNQKDYASSFDLYLTNELSKSNNLEPYKGWFAIDGSENIFSFIDIKVKHRYLSEIEDYIENENPSKKELSIVICTYKRSEKMQNVIESVINQTADKKDYEIIVVNNDINTNEVYEIVSEYRKKYNLSSKFLKYYDAPIKGLSFARNVGVFVAEGKRILFLDDDSIAFQDLVEKIIDAYIDNPNAGVVGGQIILKLPRKMPEIYVESKAAYWSQFLIEGDSYKKVKEWHEFPYGANFSADRLSLLKMGGFRTSYGRVGHNFVGGEEVVVSLLAKKTGKEIILAPLAKVYHDVDESRYTVKHIENTDLCGAYTRNRMELDLYKPIYYLIKRNSKRELKYLQQLLKKITNDKERIYILSNIKGHKEGIKELKLIGKDMAMLSLEDN